MDYSWEHFFGKKGSFTLQGNTNISGADEDIHINRSLEYLRENRTETVWQYYDRNNHDLSTQLGAELEYWLNSKVYLDISDNVSYSRTRTVRDIYTDNSEENIVGGMPTTPDLANAMGNLMLDTAAVRTSYTYEPSIFLKWKMSRVRNMDFSFAYNTTVPDLVSTLGYRNTINPLSISVGNPFLRKSHSHTTKYSYHRMWLRKQIVLGLSASYTKDINPLATLYSYNSTTGVYESKPMNVKGGDSWKFGFDYDQGIGVYFRLMNKLSVQASQSYGFLTIVDNNDPNTVPTLNHQKSVGIDEDFDLTYETKTLQLSLYDRMQWNRYRYDDASYNMHPLYNRLGVTAMLKLEPFQVIAEVADHFRSDYATSEMNGHRLISSLSVDYSFCKNKCRLSLYVDDIFNKDIYYDSKYTAFQRFESAENYIHHYANLTFSYRFDAKADKKK